MEQAHPGSLRLEPAGDAEHLIGQLTGTRWVPVTGKRVAGQQEGETSLPTGGLRRGGLEEGALTRPGATRPPRPDQAPVHQLGTAGTVELDHEPTGAAEGVDLALTAQCDAQC